MPTATMQAPRFPSIYQPLNKACRAAATTTSSVPNPLSRSDNEEARDVMTMRILSAIIAAWFTLVGIYMTQWNISDPRSITTGILCSAAFAYGACGSRRGRHQQVRFSPKTITALRMAIGVMAALVAMGFMAANLIKLFL